MDATNTHDYEIGDKVTATIHGQERTGYVKSLESVRGMNPPKQIRVTLSCGVSFTVPHQTNEERERECPNCGTDFNLEGEDGYDPERHEWFVTKDGYVCPNCGGATKW